MRGLVATLFLVSLPSGLTWAGNLEPPGPPAPTMKSLDEIPPSWSQILDSTNGDANGCNSSRFRCVMNDSAVLDLETGLVWQRAPDTTAVTWTFGVDLCENLFLGNRGGWRLPRVEELISLVDRNASNPSLPSGHPFDLSGQVEFWTSSTDQDVPTNGKGIDLIDGIVGVAPKFSSLPYWCVRGGAPNMFTSQPNS